MKEEKNGITLIALIITIIVLLILAMVSIKLIWNGGIIDHAKTATSKYTVEQEKELIGLGYSSYKMAQASDGSATLNVEEANVTGENPWTVTFAETGNVYTLKENGEIEGPKIKTEDDLAMEKYILGEDLKGQNMDNLLDETGENLKLLNGEKVEPLNVENYCYTENSEELCDGAMYIKYKNKVYRVIFVSERIATGSYGYVDTTKSVAMVYEPKGKEGQKIEYSIDGTEANKKEWTILYDNLDNIEIISPDSMGSLGLGLDDKQATGNSTFEKVVDSYNHAIEKINTYARSFVTNLNKIAVRSVGSNPANPDSRNTDIYISENLKNFNYKLGNTEYAEEINFNGLLERSDNNFEQDFVRMLYWGIEETEKSYWLASRLVYYRNGEISFGTHGPGGCTFMDTGNTPPFLPSEAAVRPVVKISK